MCGSGLAPFCTSATGAGYQLRKTDPGGAKLGYVAALEETCKHCQGDECSGT